MIRAMESKIGLDDPVSRDSRSAAQSIIEMLAYERISPVRVNQSINRKCSVEQSRG